MAAKKKQVAEAVADSASDRAKRKASDVKNGLDSVFKRMSTGSASNVDEVIPSSIEVLNRHVLGIGGWPVRRIVETFSPPGGGKSSLLFDAMYNAQRMGGSAILIESESALQLDRLTVFGVDLYTAYIAEPESVEEAIDCFRAAVAAMTTDNGPNFMGFDSLAMSSLKDVVEKGMDGRTMGVKAKLFGEQLPVIAGQAARRRCCFMIVNHAKDVIGKMFGGSVTTPGGTTPKFAASVRCQLWQGSKVKKGDEVVGLDATISCVKNKLSIPHKKAKLRLMFETGWDDAYTTINHAKDLKLISDKARGTKGHAEARAALKWDVLGPAPVAPQLRGDDDGVTETEDAPDSAD
jgi:protein RecA